MQCQLHLYFQSIQYKCQCDVEWAVIPKGSLKAEVFQFDRTLSDISQ